ncbi:MAG: glycosyltransferase family 2 protein [Rhodospirillales bacterium]|nr:glycosyltransferase family 2 protein [Rhodospirillales bacterium]
MSTRTKIDICVCTFRRPQVADTLRSLARLALNPEWTVRVIVADNDDTPSARELVEKTAQETGLSVTYVHAPARNISVARNACLDNADADYVAFLDDDEIAAPNWLMALMAEITKGDSDVVLGPVQAFYGDEAPDWMKKGDFHATQPVWVAGEIITGYSCNVLFRASAPALQGLRFRPDLGRSGGEDTVFFAAIHQNGGKIAYAPAALVTEDVPPARARLGWLLKRKFRSGQTHGLLLMEAQGFGIAPRLKNGMVAALKWGLSYIMALLNIWRFDRAAFWLLRGTLHLGVIMRLLGKSDLVQYGTEEKS